MSAAPVLGPSAVASLPHQAPAPIGDWERERRLGGLRRFSIAITVLNVLGHAYLGFETSWLHPLVALVTAYLVEGLLEVIEARSLRRPTRFWGVGARRFVEFFLSAHISAMAVSMLLYPGERLGPVVFATVTAVASKVMFRVRVQGKVRHVFNPSNSGIAVTLLLFPWVGIAPPYQFTENLLGIGDWLFPCVIICLGSFINWKFTQRLPLIAGWLIGFVAQALARNLILDAALLPALAPMTGFAFLLFTFYMITDPPTTPSSRSGQIVFGVSVAAVYGFLMALHVVFGLFFALLIVCSVRGGALTLHSVVKGRSRTASGSGLAVENGRSR